MTTVAELLANQASLKAQAEELSRELEAARQEERAGVIAHIREAMKMHGLITSDLGPAFAKYAAEGPRRTSGAGHKVAPKYRNPATGETWSGRGNKPRWLQAAIDAGSSAETFLI